MGSIMLAAVVITAAFVAGKFAGKTVMNGVRILAVVLGILALARNWDSTVVLLERFINELLPYLWGKAVSFVNWAIRNAIDVSNDAVKEITK